MRRVLSILLCVIIVCCTVSSGLADFVFRDGIEWYMSEEQVKSHLEKEAGSDQYVITDIDSSNFVSIFPQEATNPQSWLLMVENISLGSDEETVTLSLVGTKKTGLFVAFYTIEPKVSTDEYHYDRARDLLAQLEKKYGKFEKEDKWKRRKQIAQNKMVYEFSKDLKDKTIIYGYIIKMESGYELVIEYQSPRREEIEQSMQDGSFYIEPAFGL